MPAAAAVFDKVLENRNAFDPLDAPQLLKHFLAAKRVAIEKNCRGLLRCSKGDSSAPTTVTSAFQETVAAVRPRCCCARR
jgi:hypothetical protein